MKKSMRNSTFYWHHNARQFSDLYNTRSHTSIPARIVADFLKDRTDKLLTLLPPFPIQHLLDLGCGSAPYIRLLSPRCNKIVGVDYSAQMLDLARATLKKAPRKNWQLVQADANHIPFPARTFDCIIAMGLLDYVSSPLRVLKECMRVITTNGTLIASIPKKPSVFSVLRNPVGIAVKRIVFHLPPIDNALTKNEVYSLFGSAGFSVTDISSLWSAMWMIQAKSTTSQ